MPPKPPKPSETMPHGFAVSVYKSMAYVPPEREPKPCCPIPRNRETVCLYTVHGFGWWVERNDYKMKSSFDEYKTEGGGRLVYLHFGQETPKEAEERQALFQRVADSLGVHIKVGGLSSGPRRRDWRPIPKRRSDLLPEQGGHD
jgi:hypothetical protein